MRKLKSRTFLNCAIFLLSFLATLIILSIRWIRKTFGSNVEIEQILFNLQTPIITQTDPIFYQSFILKALLPALLIACIIALLNNASCIKWFKILCSFLARHIIALKATLCAGLCVTSLIYAYQKLGIKDFLANNSQDKIYSNFYEEHYIAPPLQEIAHQFSALESKRNVIVIFVESLESTFSSQNIPMGGGQHKSNASDSRIYAPFGELIPNLTNLALENLNFSETSALGGLTQVTGTGWTIAGLISYNCAIPQTQLPFKAGYNDNLTGYYLHSAVCLGDVLDSLGYHQVMFQGSDANFAATKGFFNSHHIQMRDSKYFENNKMLQGEFGGAWGVKDSIVFHFAKDYLENYDDKKPFALYLSTIDTHSPNGFVDPKICPNLTPDYENAIYCTDKVINDFVTWFKSSKYAKNTSLIILGDHLSMKQEFFPQDSKRAVYNAFINTNIKPKNKEITKNRRLSHFDITPMILESLGIHIDAFGLGRNPLTQRTLLENLGEEELNENLKKPSRIYEGFWNINKQKLK